MNRKLIFFDIDGTLCKTGEEVTERTAAAIRAARKNGHLCYLCTGRNYPIIDRKLLEIGFDGVVASAGGFIKAGDEVLFNQGFEPELWENLIEDLLKLPILLIGEGETNTYLYVPTAIGEKMSASMEEAGRQQPESAARETAGQSGAAVQSNSEMQRMHHMISHMSLKQLEEYDGEQIYKISCMCPRDDLLKPLEEKYQGIISVVYHSGVGVGGMSNHEISPAGVDKGTAVLLLAEYYGIKPEDTIGFGDSMNDAPMLAACGMGVCMANGSGELKAVSRWICPAVEEDGVAQMLERMELTAANRKAMDFGKAVNAMTFVNRRIERAAVKGYKGIEQVTVKGYKEVEKATVRGYKEIEKATVQGYKWLESNAVKGYKRLEKKMIDHILERYLAGQQEESRQAGTHTQGEEASENS